MSMGKSEKTKSSQYEEEEEDYEENSEEEDELYLLSRRVNHIWKKNTNQV